MLSKVTLPNSLMVIEQNGLSEDTARKYFI